MAVQRYVSSSGPLSMLAALVHRPVVCHTIQTTHIHHPLKQIRWLTVLGQCPDLPCVLSPQHSSAMSWKILSPTARLPAKRPAPQLQPAGQKRQSLLGNVATGTAPSPAGTTSSAQLESRQWTTGAASWKQPPATASTPSSVLAGNAASGASALVQGRSTDTSWKQPSVDADQKAEEGVNDASWKRPSATSSATASLGLQRHGPAPRHEVHICAAMLQLVCPGETKSTVYRSHGKAVKRIQAALEIRHCNNTACALCGPTPQLQLADVEQVCHLWHSLSDDAQANYLAAMYEAPVGEGCGLEPTEETCQHRTEYVLCGHKICKDGLVSLLGISQRALYKKLNRDIDMRKAGRPLSTGQPQRQTVRPLIDLFFMELYHSASEDLPEHQHAEDVDGQIMQDTEDPQAVGIPPKDIEEIFTWTPEAALSERAVHFLGPNASAPMRHLPPGKPVTLFWQFLAWCEAMQSLGGPGGLELQSLSTPPSWSSFWRAWTEKWRKILKFRKTSQHKECSACHDFREKVHSRRLSVATKMQVAREWREHLRAQYHDRLVYWSLRASSRMHLNVLCIIVDSMDKVKTVWPKYAAPRKPAYLEGLKRPRSILSAVLCHGWCTCIFTADEELSHGAGAFCEILCRALDEVQRISRETGRAIPQHLVVQSDNTTAQTKNSLSSVFMAYLVAKGKFLTATLNFLTVGHTHEDVDRLFSLILLTVLQRQRWEVPADLVRLLQQGLRPHAESKNETLLVQEVQHIRDFDHWLDALGIRLHNAFVSRQGREASHSFTYKIRADLTPREMALLPRRGGRAAEDHTEDVFAIVKGRMHMTQSQPPLLALPHCRLSRVGDPCPAAVMPKHEVPAARIRELEKLASIFDDRHPTGYPQAAQCIRAMLAGGGGAAPPALQWLSGAAAPRAVVAATTNQYYEHLPDSAWRLLATFRRQEH